MTDSTSANLDSEQASAVAASAPVNPEDQRLAAVELELRRLNEQFEQKLAVDAVKDQQIKQLHAELQQHRQGLLQSAMQPLLLQIIRLRDDVARREAGLRQKPAEQLDAVRLFRELAGFGDDLLMLLEGGGAAAFEEAAAAFNPARQQAVSTTKTTDPRQHALVAQRVHPGYEAAGRLLVKERVRVYVYEAPAAAITCADAASDDARES